ncbi:MAG: hypothetical protein E6Q88_04045 [Lysobacteraceae bacterium]|nr:MAG: hypothetical protein E6Q88_04045 [Xanthomonadaceae bacterium]
MRPHDVPWRETLATVLSKLLRTPVSAAEAASSLALLDARHFLALDQAMRPGFWTPNPFNRLPLITAGEPREDIEACFFAAGCTARGFVRESALAALAPYPGRLATALALIRCDDWVPQVEARAQGLLQAQIALHPDTLFGLLDLIAALRARERFGRRTWPQIVQPQLLRADLAEARRHASHGGSASSRLFAYRLMTEADSPERVSAAREHAIRDPDPVIARWALDDTQGASTPNAALLAQGLRHPHASVRAQALRRYAEYQPTDLPERIRQALFDPARSPRNVAAYLLRAREGSDPRTLWRRALDADGADDCPAGSDLRLRRRTALTALSECAEAQDAERMRGWLAHPSGKVRAIALCGYARSGADDLAIRLTGALRDPSTRVVREAIARGAGIAAVLTTETLDAARREAPNAAVRAHLTDAARLLGKWQALDLLLAWRIDAKAADAEAIDIGIGHWLASANRKYARLDGDTRTRLETRFAAAAAALNATHRSGIAQTLRFA